MKTSFEKIKKTVSLSIRLIVGILIMVFSLTGCSDMPYTGSMLTPDDVHRYLISLNEGTFCLQYRADSACITLVPELKDPTVPIIHIYPSGINYVFYYEGKPILEAERITDTTNIIEDLIGDRVPRPSDDGDGGTPPGGDGDGGTPPGGDGDGGTPPGGDGNGGTPPGGDGNGGTPPGGDGNGGTPPGGDGNGGTPPGGDGDGGTPPGGDGDGGTPPGTISSHYVFSNPSHTSNREEWIVWIYYPDDYGGPRGLLNSPEGFGFTITVDGGETTQFAQVSGGERGAGVQLVIVTDLQEIEITITWDPPHTDRSATFTLKSDVNILG